MLYSEQEIRTAISKLPGPCAERSREIAQAVLFEGRTFTAIGKDMDRSCESVRQYWRRIAYQLYRFLES